GPLRHLDSVPTRRSSDLPDISTEEGRAEISKTIDALGDVFVAKVARNLGVDADKVPAMGDHGGLMVGAAAVKAGLAHRLGSLETDRKSTRLNSSHVKISY